MEDNRKEQIEALEVLLEFNERLVKNMHIIVKELSGKRLDDTDKFLKSIVDAINWEIQVVNGTMEVINDGEERLDKEAFNKAVSALAAEFENVIPVFENLGEIVAKVVK